MYWTFAGDSTAAYTQCTAACTHCTAAYTCGTAAYIVNCDFNENPKSEFDFDLGFVNIRKENTWLRFFRWQYVGMVPTN